MGPGIARPPDIPEGMHTCPSGTDYCPGPVAVARVAGALRFYVASVATAPSALRADRPDATLLLLTGVRAGSAAPTSAYATNEARRTFMPNSCPLRGAGNSLCVVRSLDPGQRRDRTRSDQDELDHGTPLQRPAGEHPLGCDARADRQVHAQRAAGTVRVPPFHVRGGRRAIPRSSADCGRLAARSASRLTACAAPCAGA